jgi:hypothetical protein
MFMPTEDFATGVVAGVCFSVALAGFFSLYLDHKQRIKDAYRLWVYQAKMRTPKPPKLGVSK